jgi:hypothetical protein
VHHLGLPGDHDLLHEVRERLWEPQQQVPQQPPEQRSRSE